MSINCSDDFAEDGMERDLIRCSICSCFLPEDETPLLTIGGEARYLCRDCADEIVEARGRR